MSLEICTWRPRLSQFGGRNRASLEIQLESVIERGRRCTWRPLSGELGGPHRASLDEYIDAVDGRRTGC